jgi:pimeloyl-ACP methyl ester carboxylesterase
MYRGTRNLQTSKTPVTTHTINVSEFGKLTYHVVGKGEPIIFFHGLLMNHLLFADVVPFLEKYTVILPDLPLGAHQETLNPGADITPRGIAKMMSLFVSSVAKEHNLKGITVVGNDSGGALTQIMLANFPSTPISRLVLYNCDAYYNFPPPVLRPFVWFCKIEFIGTWFIRLFSKLLANPSTRKWFWVTGWLTKKGISQEIADKLVEPGQKNPKVVQECVQFTGAVNNRDTLDAAEKLKSFSKPTLILWGKDDPFFPYTDGQKLNGVIKNSKFEMVDDSYCFMSFDQPKILAEKIDNFIQANPLD